MPLITTISQIRSFLPLNAGFQYADIEPFIKEVEFEFITPILGADQLAALIAEGSPNAEEAELILRCRRAITYLATLKWIPFGNLQISGGGFMVNAGDKMAVASQWRVDKLEEQLYQEGYNKLEPILEYVWSQPEGTFPDWDDSDEKLEQRTLVILTAKEFSKYYNIKNSYYTYLQLKPAMREVEEMYVKATLGVDLYNELKDEIQENAVSADNEIIVTMCKRAIAPLAIYEAVASMGIELSHLGITVQENSPLQTTNVRKQAPDNRVSYAIRQAKADGQKHLGNLRAYLNANATDSLYALYYDSNLYNDPENEDTDDDDEVNEEDSGFFVM